MRIRPFSPEDQDAVKELILRGLEERWGSRDPSLNRDLDDIACSYGRGTFLVATEHDEIVGTGAVIERGGGTAEVLRMSVATGRRGRGIGTAILDELIRSARAGGVRTLILETTATWTDAIRFYQRRGFVFSHEYDGDAYFVMELGGG